jgi:O-antigen/teichoic acid export membrane protein
MLGYEGYESCIMYMGGILALDSVTAILFAKLRQEHKALKFAIFKTVKILVETGANIYLFFAPKPEWMYNFISQTPDFSYVMFAIFISCAVCALLFIPDLLKFSFEFDGKLLKQMFLYSLPLMVAGLPGILNDFVDRILFRFLDTNAQVWQSSLGVFQAAVKLSVIMNLFIQMFRFAAEPFFFQRAKDKGSKQLYATVMEYFTAFCGFVFLGVILYMDIIGLIIGQDFRAALGVVPVMLLSYMLLGLNFNVSMWYKLAEKTSMAIYITLAGLAVTIVVNLAFMPLYSYWAAAFGHLLSYLVMFIVSAVLGQKYYPIPYRWNRIISFFIFIGVIYGLTYAVDTFFFSSVYVGGGTPGLLVLKLATHTVLLGVYLLASWKILKTAKLTTE